MASAAVTRSLLPARSRPCGRGLQAACRGAVNRRYICPPIRSPTAGHSLIPVPDALLAQRSDPLAPFTPAAFFTAAQPLNPATLLLVVAGLLYGYGLVRLRRRGLHWPVGRTVMFGLGLALMFVATGTGLGAYDTTLLSVHMVQH